MFDGHTFQTRAVLARSVITTMAMEWFPYAEAICLFVMYGCTFDHFALHTNFKTIVWCHIEAAFTTWQGLYWLSVSLTSSKNFSGCNLFWFVALFVIWHFAVDRGSKWQLNLKAKTKMAYIFETKRRRAKIAIICDHFSCYWHPIKCIEAAQGHFEIMFAKKSANGKCQQTNGHASLWRLAANKTSY